MCYSFKTKEMKQGKGILKIQGTDKGGRKTQTQAIEILVKYLISHEMGQTLNFAVLKQCWLIQGPVGNLKTSKALKKPYKAAPASVKGHVKNNQRARSQFMPPQTY